MRIQVTLARTLASARAPSRSGISRALAQLQQGQGFFRCWRRKLAIDFGEILPGQFDIERARVFTHVDFVASFWNSDDAGLTQHPGEGDLSRG